MAKILVLPEHIASQIAAGEVVERPSSAVKELVENSIDAGAARITIEISEGCRHIRVADTGSGMEPADAALAFQRHATSKLSSADDLWNLNTLGFRGEALPSIAAVSHLTCYTRTENKDAGTKIICVDGNISVSETGCAKGTTIEIEDLFYNVPARLKFLKKAATEFAYIHEIIQSLAITYPEIAFQLSLDGKTRLATHGSGKLDQTLQESGFFNGDSQTKETNLISIETRDGVLGMEINGRLASAVSFRGDRKGILTIVNGRPVRCGLTYKALDNAYADLIPRGRYPLAVVHLKINPSELDVNIHPTKKEIRYSKGNEIYLFLQRQIAHALRMSRNVHAEPAASPALNFTPQTFSYIPEKSMQLSLKESDFEHTVGAGIYTRPHISESRADAIDPYKSMNIISTRASINPRPYESTAVFPSIAPSRLPLDWRIAGYIANTYILLETQAGLKIVEQHIAHERYLYEQFLVRTTEAKNDERQNLVISLPLSLSEEQKSVLKENLSALQTQGFDFDIENENISCSQVPVELAHKDYAKIIQSILQELAAFVGAGIHTRPLSNDVTHRSANPQLEIVKSLACQAAIKNGMPLAHEQIIDLLNLWHTCPRNETCPHGRPIQLDFSFDKLFQLFHPG